MSESTIGGMENSSLQPEAADQPRTPEDVEARYMALRTQHQSRQDQIAQQKSHVGWALLLCFLVIVALALRSGNRMPAWPLLAGFAVLLTLIPIHLGLQTKASRTERLLSLYDRNLARVRSGDWQSGNTGESLRMPRHLFERDLNLLGENSLFGLLDTVRTGIGQKGLANYLQNTVAHQESVSRQEAVRELTSNIRLREEIALLGASRFQQVEARYFDAWLNEESPSFHPSIRFILATTTFLLMLILLLGFTHTFSWNLLLPNVALVGALQVGISMYLRSKVTPVLERVTRLSNHVQLFSEGLALLQGQCFTCEKLIALQQTAHQPANAVSLLAKLQSQITIVQQRSKEYFFIFSMLLAAGTQAALAISDWKKKHAAGMQNWLTAWAEFEALNAFALYAFENPQNAWPHLLPAEHPPHLSAKALGHPLLNKCVLNDIELGARVKFYLISGSNMSGKSTLMRSIGVNAVLAYAGAPVRAKSMTLTPLALGASLALIDSLADGKSKFLAEVERLQQILQTSMERPVLFLVDEIFSGTNSADRKAAAQAVLENLLVSRAIGALSTHDLALAELANDANGGINVHMASPDTDNPLNFDYKLKPGLNTSSNAIAIIRMMGIDSTA